MVNFGGSITPVISSSTTAESCHVITPNGEDLLITTNSHYPNITRHEINQWSCTIEFSPIHAPMLGDWTIYVIYAWSSTQRRIDRRDIHFFLYGTFDIMNHYKRDNLL